MNNPEIQAQSPLKTYTRIDVYYEAHEAVLAAKKAWMADKSKENWSALYDSLKKRMGVFDTLSLKDQQEIVTVLFPSDPAYGVNGG